MTPGDIIQKYGQVVWDAAVRQVLIQQWVDLVWIIFFVVFFIAMSRWIPWSWRKTDAVQAAKASSYDDQVPWMVMTIGSIIATFVMALIFPLVVIDLVYNVLNPQWQAIQIIMSQVPGK